MSMIMAVLMIIGVPVRAAFGLEHRADRFERGAEAAQHVLQDMIAADAQGVPDDLHLGVPIAGMPSEPRQRGRIGCGYFDQRLRLPVDTDDRSIIEDEAVTGVEVCGFREIKNEARVFFAGEHDPPAMALIGIERDSIASLCGIPLAGPLYLACSPHVAGRPFGGKRIRTENTAAPSAAPPRGRR